MATIIMRENKTESDFVLIGQEHQQVCTKCEGNASRGSTCTIDSGSGYKEIIGNVIRKTHTERKKISSQKDGKNRK